MDTYTKFILSIIAVGILGLNYHLFNGEIMNQAHAASNQIHKIAICEPGTNRCARISEGIRAGELVIYNNGR